MKVKFFKFEDIIIHEDDNILVVNKPLGVASLDDKNNRNLNTLAKAHNPDLQLSHCLDKLTSGVLVMAKNPEAYRDIAIQFQRREVSKNYLTIVKGTHHFKEMEVDLALQIGTNHKVFPNKQLGKKAQTFFSTKRNFRNYTVISCRPVTGRMHQIRVHLAAQNYPIIGDELYGGEDIYLSGLKRNYSWSNKREERPINHGFLLHAESISFKHPQTEEMVTYEAPLPKNFKVTLKLLEKFNGI